MKQLSFFDGGENEDVHGLLAGLIDYKASVFTGQESTVLMLQLIKDTPWTQRSVLMYGKEVITPRLTAWYGDPDADYSVSVNGSRPLPWTQDLLIIKSRIETLAGTTFNSVLLNYYRDGNDSVSWHSDNDGIPGRNKIVASVSFGQVRNFDMRKTDDHTQKYSISLENGSYLLMKSVFQDEWQHRVAKSNSAMKARINLTFRKMP